MVTLVAGVPLVACRLEWDWWGSAEGSSIAGREMVVRLENMLVCSPLAQLVERVTVNHEAVGSIPTWRDFGAHFKLCCVARQ